MGNWGILVDILRDILLEHLNGHENYMFQSIAGVITTR